MNLFSFINTFLNLYSLNCLVALSVITCTLFLASLVTLNESVAAWKEMKDLFISSSIVINLVAKFYKNNKDIHVCTTNYDMCD